MPLTRWSLDRLSDWLPGQAARRRGAVISAHAFIEGSPDPDREPIGNRTRFPNRGGRAAAAGLPEPGAGSPVAPDARTRRQQRAAPASRRESNSRRPWRGSAQVADRRRPSGRPRALRPARMAALRLNQSRGGGGRFASVGVTWPAPTTWLHTVRTSHLASERHMAASAAMQVCCGGLVRGSFVPPFYRERTSRSRSSMGVMQKREVHVRSAPSDIGSQQRARERVATGAG